jgi:co-chaperonin GroES (HSP10)
MITIQPVGEYVLVKSIEYSMPKERKSKGGIIMVEAAPGQPGVDTRPTHYWVVEGIGPDVDTRRTDIRIGIKVFFNEYNCKKIRDYDDVKYTEYGLILPKDIMGYYTESEFDE